MFKKTLILIATAGLFSACSKPAEDPAKQAPTDDSAKQAVTDNSAKPESPASAKPSESDVVVDNQNTPPQKDARDATNPAPEYNTQLIVGDTEITLPEFGIEIVLTDKAKDELSKTNETIIVAAYHTVMATENSPKAYEKYIGDGSVPEITLIDVRKEITLDNLKADFKGITYPKEIYNVLTEADRDSELLINVFSGRRSSDLNLLDCDLLQDKISVVAGKTHSLKCKLIGESTYN